MNAGNKKIIKQYYHKKDERYVRLILLQYLIIYSVHK